MKKFFVKILVLVVAALTLVFCMGMDANCPGVSCGIDTDPLKCKHSYKVIEEKESTCAEAGYVRMECKICHDIKRQDKPKLEHDITITLHRGTCKFESGVEISALMLSWYEEEVCSQCDYDKINYYYNSLHDGGYLHFYDEGELEVNEDNGCGEIVYTCLICGEKYREVYHCKESPQQQECDSLRIAARGKRQCGSYFKKCDLCENPVSEKWHDYFEATLVEPTRTEYGLARISCRNRLSNDYGGCSVLNYTYYKLIPPTEDNEIQ